jgi:ATP-dependent Lon protease
LTAEVDQALEEAMNKRWLILLAAQREARPTIRARDDIYRVGTLGTVVQVALLPDGTVKVLVEGKKRASCATSTRASASWSRPRRSRRCVEDHRDRGADALINSTFEHYVKLNKKIPQR